jgi:hypothetical protein
MIGQMDVGEYKGDSCQKKMLTSICDYHAGDAAIWPVNTADVPINSEPHRRLGAFSQPELEGHSDG